MFDREAQGALGAEGIVEQKQRVGEKVGAMERKLWFYIILSRSFRYFLTLSIFLCYNTWMIEKTIPLILRHHKNTYLRQYLESAIRSYQEPVREGVAKGTAYGPSTKQFAAAAFKGLTTIRTRDIARRGGFSEPSIRNWDITESFQDLKEQHRRAFVEFVREALKNGLKPDSVYDHKLYHKQLSEMLAPVLNIGEMVALAPMPDMSAEAFQLMAGDELMKEIDKCIPLLSKKIMRRDDKSRLLDVLQSTKLLVKGGGG